MPNLSKKIGKLGSKKTEKIGPRNFGNDIGIYTFQLYMINNFYMQRSIFHVRVICSFAIVASI